MLHVAKTSKWPRGGLNDLHMDTMITKWEFGNLRGPTTPFPLSVMH